ncbi:MAG: right-handed parallel beta-helix repeat-containing protein [Phycisphaerae bacterium]|nr:right-handed parallel beta-helix repeat-containing protein [Gemmatimonadaceae bacterium]
MRRFHQSLFLAVFGIPSCGEPAAGPSTEVAGPIPPVMAPAVFLDVALLHDLNLQRLAVGEERSLVFDSIGNAPVAQQDVVLRDTTVATLDQSGVLRARTAGSSWVVWSHAESVDSSVLTITPLDSLANQSVRYREPALPQKTVDVRYPAARGRGARAGKTIRVEAGGNLQAALNAAQPGDEVVLAQGAVFTGNFVLPAKSSGTPDWIVVRADVLPVGFGTRVTRELASPSAKVITPNTAAAIITAKGARHWRLVGFQVELAPIAALNYGIVVLGSGASTDSTLASVPSDIILDRMMISGSMTGMTSRCVAMNGIRLAVIDSHLDECHAKGADAQGIGGWNGPGPFVIENNYIAASGQGVMFGGADPFIANVTPSDVTIRRNYFYKPMTWANNKWSIKATFELKHAQRVLFEGNVLENHWISAQVGYAILFQTVSQNNRAPWTVIQDVTVRNNLIRNATSGVNVLSRFNNVPILGTRRVLFQGNVFDDVGRDPVTGAKGTILQLLHDVEDISFVNNTIVHSAGDVSKDVYFDGVPGVRTVVMHNIFPLSSVGIGGSGKAAGNSTLATFAPGAIVEGNVLPGLPAASYPPNNYYPKQGPALPLGSPRSSSETCTAMRPWLDGLGVQGIVGANCSRVDTAISGVVLLPPI